VHVDDEYVNVTVIVEVTERASAAAVSSGDARTGDFDQLFERLIAEITENGAWGFVGILRKLTFNFRVNVPRNHEEIGITVVVEVEHAGAPANVAGLHGDASLTGDIIEIGLSVVVVENARVVGEMGFEEVQVAVEVIITDADAHASLLVAIVAEGHATENAFFAERAVVIVHEQQAGSGIASDVDIRPAILVEIGGDHGHAVALGKSGDAGLLADVSEAAITIVAIQGMMTGGKAARATLDRHAAEIAIGAGARNGGVFEGEADVIGDEQVKMAIAIVIDKSATGAPARLVVEQAGVFGDIGEGAVTIVAEQDVLAEIGAENVVEAVIIIIADADPVGPADRVETSFFGDVGESAVAIVFVKAIGGLGRRAVNAGATKQEEIHPAIIVVVDEGTTTAIGFDDVLVDLIATVNGGVAQASRGGHVDEMGIKWAARGSLTGHGLGGATAHALSEKFVHGNER